MKLISVNAEGTRHYDRVLSLIEREQPDVVCIQEAAENYVDFLANRGYSATFTPRAYKIQEDKEYVDGQIIASHHPHNFEQYCYYEEVRYLRKEKFKEEHGRYNSKQCVHMAKILIDNEEFVIATTHFTWAPDGRVVSEAQREDMKKLLNYVQDLPAHVLCGDFNLSRQHADLYKDLCKVYTDNIPEEYTSSMDKNLHIKGNDPSRAHMFNSLMVDYVFSQPPYEVTDVRLEFGISDHAAVIGEITLGD